MLYNTDMKRCSKCLILQSVSNFGKHKYTKDGLKSWCNACNTKASIAWAKSHPDEKRKNGILYHQRHREERLAKQREYTAMHREEIRQRDREYTAMHREEAKKRAAEWYANNKEKARQNGILYRIKNKDAIKAKHATYDKIHNIEKVARNNKRRAAKRNNGGTYTKEEFIQLCQKYENRCLMCGRNNIKLTVDHVIPISLGGSNSIENIQPLCISCNSKKHQSILDLR